MSIYVRLYKALLHLYPSSYRQEYESEMILLFSDILGAAETRSEKMQLLIASISDAFRYLPRAAAEQAELSFNSSPTFIKMNTIIIAVCMLPFFLATFYQLHMLHDHEAKPALLSLVVHTRQFYTIGLPSVGLSVAIVTIAWSLFKSEQYWLKNWQQLLREAWHNSLLIFAGLGLLALAIIC